jgi:pterin-4a-carbinolamine dehydratase
MDKIEEKVNVLDMMAVAWLSEPGGPVRMDLKPERVQQLLLALPGWKLREDGRAIVTARKFTSAQTAGAFGALACRLATQQRQPVAVRLMGEQIVITLPGHPLRGCAGGLTGPVFKLAGLIGS